MASIHFYTGATTKNKNLCDKFVLLMTDEITSQTFMYIQRACSFYIADYIMFTFHYIFLSMIKTKTKQ
jgi:hypothetical protein